MQKRHHLTRDWLRETWPYLLFDALWLAGGVALWRRASER